MTDRNRQRCVLVGLTAIAAGVFFTGIGWGLPSRARIRIFWERDAVERSGESCGLRGARAMMRSAGRIWRCIGLRIRSRVVMLNETDRQRRKSSGGIGCIRISRMRC